MADQVTTETKPVETQQTTETKPTETKPVETKPTETKPVETKVEDKKDESFLGDTPKQAIEYKDFTLPEGVELAPEGITEAKALFNKYALPQEAAQELVTLAANQMKGATVALETAGQKLWDDTKADWKKAIESDPEIGGAKLPEVRASISKVLDKYATPKFREALKFTGAGDNPEVIKTLWKMATALSEGKNLGGNPPPDGGAKTLAERMYPGGVNTNIQGRTKELN